MKALVLAGALALALALPVAAQTPEPAPSVPVPACNVTVLSAQTEMAVLGIPSQILDGEGMAVFLKTYGLNAEGVTRVVVANINGMIYYGLETEDGCLTAPARPLPSPVGTKQSGATANGVGA